MFYWKDTKSNKHQSSFLAFLHRVRPSDTTQHLPLFVRQRHWPDPSHPCLWAPLPTLLFKGLPRFKELTLHVCLLWKPGTYTLNCIQESQVSPGSDPWLTPVHALPTECLGKRPQQASSQNLSPHGFQRETYCRCLSTPFPLFPLGFFHLLAFNLYFPTADAEFCTLHSTQQDAIIPTM